MSAPDAAPATAEPRQPEGSGVRPPDRRLVRAVTALLPYAVFCGVLLLVPAVFTRLPPFTMSDGVQMVLLAIAAAGLVPLTGYAGQVSLGQAAFYGTGAYASAILTVRYEGSPWLGILAGALLAGAMAYVLGLLLFRVAGHYLALATIAFGLMLGVVAQELEITGGGQGLPGVPPLTFGGAQILGDVNFYYLCAAVLLLVSVAVRTLTRSALAKTLTAIGDSQIAAQSCGISPVPFKRVMFVLAAVLSALAGSLYAHWTGYVDAHTMELTLSLQMLIVVTIGGRRSVFGAVVGAFVVVSLVRVSKEWLPSVSEQAGGQVELIAYGAALILVLRFAPQGVAGTTARFIARRWETAHGPRAPEEAGTES